MKRLLTYLATAAVACLLYAANVIMGAPHDL